DGAGDGNRTHVSSLGIPRLVPSTLSAAFVVGPPPDLLIRSRCRFVSAGSPDHRLETIDTRTPRASTGASPRPPPGCDLRTTNSPTAGRFPLQPRRRAKPLAALTRDCERRAPSCFASHSVSPERIRHESLLFRSLPSRLPALPCAF